MERFLKTKLDAHGRKGPGASFIAWDALDKPASSATHRNDINRPMSFNDRRHFATLAPGRHKNVDGFEYLHID